MSLHRTVTLDFSFSSLKSILLETELIYLSVPRSSQNPLILMYLQSKPKFRENTETLWLSQKWYFEEYPILLEMWRMHSDSHSSSFSLLIWITFYRKTNFKCGLLSPLCCRFKKKKKQPGTDENGCLATLPCTFFQGSPQLHFQVSPD